MHSITVIIPIYNVELYLEQCLDSVVNQSKPFDQVILINDGSTDKSLDICKKYASDYDYFTVIDQPNQGQGAARNRGLETANGEYILFLDADDWLELNTGEVLGKYLDEDNLDAVFFDAEIINEVDNLKITRNYYDRKDAGLDGRVMNGIELFIASYPHAYVECCYLTAYKNSVINSLKLRFPEGIYYEDVPFNFCFLEGVERLIHISQKLYNRRYRPNSTMTSEISEKKLKDHIVCASLMWKQIDQSKIWNDSRGKEILARYTHSFCERIIKDYKDIIEQKIVFEEKTLEMLQDIIKQYFLILEERFISRALTLPELNDLLKHRHNIFTLGLDDSRIMVERMCAFSKKVKYYYVEILSTLPLDQPNRKVGVYGIGKHTEGLLTIYERLIGEIKCELVFIVSREVEKGEKYKNRMIINYQEVDSSIDFIILSSFCYESELEGNIMKVTKDIPIRTFYNIDDLNRDIFSGCEVFLDYC